MPLDNLPVNQFVSLAKSQLEEAHRSLELNGFAIIRDAIDPCYANRLAQVAKTYFLELAGEPSLNDALRGNFGAGMPNNEGYTRDNTWYLYRSCFFPWNRTKPQLLDLVEISRYLSGVRNSLIGLPFDQGSCLEADGLFAYTSLSLYPSGGGFLTKHADGHKNVQLIHFKVELSQKGIDYTDGGFYLWDREGRPTDISSILRPTDLLFFDGSLNHEIKPIFGNGIGRIAIFEIPTYVNPDSLKWSCHQRQPLLTAKKIAKRILRPFNK